MALKLEKGETVSLSTLKTEKGEFFDLSTVTIGLGWDVREQKQGFLSSILGGSKQKDYDLDAVAFCLNRDNKVANLGKELQFQNGDRLPLQQSDVIFFHNLTLPSGNFGVYSKLSKEQIKIKVRDLIKQGEYIIHTGDNLTGEGDGDDEQIIVRLNLLPSRIERIVFLVCIYQGEQNGQHFGMVDNAFIRAVDARGKEITRFSLSSESDYNGMRSLTFAELYRKDGGWKFKAIGTPHQTDMFVQLLKKYLPND